MPSLLALDAGGTKTECRLSLYDPGTQTHQTLARTRTGSIKILRVGEDLATARLRDLLTETSTLAGVPLADIRSTCIGLAGISIPIVRQWAARSLADLLPTSTLVLSGDDEIALDAAFHGGPGILAIAGTGSNVVARALSGQTSNAGGWGPAVGDEGSGHWIGQNAIRFALNALDADPGQPPTRNTPSSLLEAIQRHWDLASLDHLITLVNQLPHPDFSTLVPVIAKFAAAGDPIALRTLEQAGQDLAIQVASSWRRLHQPPNFHVEVAHTGSILTHLSPVRQSMGRTLATLLPQATLQNVGVDPLDGALWRAAQALPPEPLSLL